MATEAEILAAKEAEEAAAAAAAAAKKVTFDENQQAFFNKTLQERLARQEEKLKKDHEAAIATLREELKTEFAKPAKKAGGEDDADAKEAQYKEILANERAKTKNAELLAQKLEQDAKKAREEVYLNRKENAITKAASKQPFIDLADVIALTQRLVDWDDETGDFVVKENGIIKQNNELKPMKLDQFFEQWGAARPHFLNGEVKGGAGSAEARRQVALKPTSKAQLDGAKGRSEFIAKYGYDAFEALPAK